MVFLTLNIVFAWFSPGWIDSLGKVLIDGQEQDNSQEENEKFPDIKILASLTTVKVGSAVRAETSLRGVSAGKLKNICDRQAKTKLTVNGKTRKGDQITLKYSKSFKCKGISFSLNGDKNFSGQLQTSADGIVFSTVKSLKSGSNNITLKNETIKALRIVINKDIQKKWTLGDVSCR